MDEKKPNWMQKLLLKQSLKNAKRKLAKIKKKHEKKQEQKTRENMIKALINLTDVFTIYEDDQKTIKTTKEMLNKKTDQELLELLELIIEETNNEIKWLE